MGWGGAEESKSIEQYTPLFSTHALGEGIQIAPSLLSSSIWLIINKKNAMFDILDQLELF